ncbi:MAG: hypothetical protein ACK41V_11160 [Acidovorax sp.]|uniref:hypothetical protein n=1 Tax=Acidovorax sp. TaxID=1872122 RepID=UPI00391DB01A
MKLGQRWAGSVYGTNVGNFFLNLTFDQAGNSCTGRLHFNDAQLGFSVYEVAGTFTDGLALLGIPVEPASPGISQISVSAKLAPDGTLRGEWSSVNGGAGTVIAFPHDKSQEITAVQPSSAPEQLFSATHELRALRLARESIVEITDLILREFPGGRLIVTYSVRGNDVTRYLEHFLSDLPGANPLRRFKLHIQTPDVHGILRMVTVDLGTFGKNEVRVQGASETWVVGHSEALTRKLSEYESFLVTSYKKFGLGLNSFIFLGMLIVLPEITSSSKRAAFVVGCIAIQQFLLWAHTRFIPELLVFPAKPAPSVWLRLLPSIASWVIAVTSALVATWLYKALGGA